VFSIFVVIMARRPYIHTLLQQDHGKVSTKFRSCYRF